MLREASCMPDTLLIDDDHFSRKLTRTMLAKAGITEVTEASGGRQAVSIARTLSPELILIDWVMPGMDGEQTLQALNAEALLPPECHVIVTSTLATREAIVQAARLGANAFLIKPFAARTLHARIARLMETQPKSDQAPLKRLGGER